jgi:beta-lactamase superfamily II metal-dependent hydrolase
MITRRGFAGLFAAAATSAATGTIERKSFFKDGAKMICLSNRSRSQMLGVVFVSPTGQVAVVDGGSPAEAQAIHEIVAKHGGEVACWMITHAHLDHFGALMGLLERPANARPKIRSLRYSFPSCEWIKEREPKRLCHVERFLQAVAASGIKPEAANPGEICDLGGGTRFVALNDFDLSVVRHSINNTSICFSVAHGGRKILIPGDLSVEGGNRLMKLMPEKLPHEIVFMAHHGQQGVDKDFYGMVKPKVAIWPTPRWLWDNDRLNRPGGIGSGNFQTNYVKCWLQELGVKEQYLLTEDIVFA